MKSVDEVIGAVHAEQVGATFQQVPIAIVVNVVNAGITATIVAASAPTKLAPLWFGAVTLVSIGRWLLWRRYQRATPKVQNVRTWGILVALGSLLAGLSWGLGGAVLLPAIPGLGQTFFILVIGGMCAGAVVLNVPHLPTLLAFLLSASLPVAFRLLATGSMADTALAAMIIVFAVALSLAGAYLNRFFTEGLRLRFELNGANIRLRAEMAEHRETEAALRQAQKLEAVGQLTGGIAHDFNNLLTVVSGNAALLRDKAPDDVVARRASAIIRAAEQGERLTRQLLAFSRRQMLRPEAVDLRQRKREIAEMLSQVLRENIEVTVEMPENLWPVTVDPTEFELALLNVGFNARDAMPNGGCFRFEACNLSFRPGDSASEGLIGDFVAVRLSDAGAGMGAEVLARAFEPFFTTKEVGLGSGLGLSQVYGFAKQSGGAASLASEVGKGTSITLFLPRATALPAARSDGGENALPAVSVRVLVVEDDTEVAAVTAELLRDIGYQPIEAHDGYGALAILERDPAIEFVLSDIVMAGGISGFDLARTLRERRPELPVLLATGYSRYARQVVEEGFELVEKPYRREALTVSIKAALGRARSGRSIAAGATETTLRT